MKTEVTVEDILDAAAYEAVRAEKRTEMIEVKKKRRVSVGPDTTFYFESWDSMWLQIQERLRAEKGGDQQLIEELAAYNPLVPKGRNLSATFMIEIADDVRRDHALSELGNIDRTISLKFGKEIVWATPDGDVERTNEEGRASSVHFLLFHFNDQQAMTFSAGDAEVLLCIEHEKYHHMAVLPEAVRRSLAGDFL